MPAEYLLETTRLRLRHLLLNDREFIIQLLNSPGWLKFIGDRNVHTLEEATRYLENGPWKSYELNGYGLSLVERKEDGAPIGMCGLLKRDVLDVPDMGYAFLPEANGQGYASEIVRATLIYARENFSLAKIGAIVLPTNKKSIAVLERCEFVFEKRIKLTPDGQELLIYVNE